MGSVIGVFLGISLVVIGVLYNGWALSICWNWAAPEIFGLPELTLPYAIATAGIVGFVSSHCYDDKRREGMKLVQQYAYIILRPLILILIVWLCMK